MAVVIAMMALAICMRAMVARLFSAIIVIEGTSAVDVGATGVAVVALDTSYTKDVAHEAKAEVTQSTRVGVCMDMMEGQRMMVDGSIRAMDLREV